MTTNEREKQCLIEREKQCLIDLIKDNNHDEIYLIREVISCFVRWLRVIDSDEALQKMKDFFADLEPYLFAEPEGAKEKS